MSVNPWSRTRKIMKWYLRTVTGCGEIHSCCLQAATACAYSVDLTSIMRLQYDRDIYDSDTDSWIRLRCCVSFGHKYESQSPQSCPRRPHELDSTSSLHEIIRTNVTWRNLSWGKKCGQQASATAAGKWRWHRKIRVQPDGEDYIA